MIHKDYIAAERRACLHDCLRQVSVGLRRLRFTAWVAVANDESLRASVESRADYICYTHPYAIPLALGDFIDTP